MIESTFTLARLAEIFCKADGRSEAEKGAVWNKLRSIHQRGFIKELDRSGPGGATRFSINEAVIARLLSVAVEFGIETANLEALTAQLKHGGRRSVSPVPGDTYDYSLNGFIESLADLTQEWVLVVGVGYASGALHRAATFLPAHIKPKPSTAAVTITMQATRLVRPLLSDA